MREVLKIALACLETGAAVIVIVVPAARAVVSKLDACKASVQEIKSEQK